MIKNMQVNNAEDLDVVIPMIEHSNKYLKTSKVYGYYKDYQNDDIRDSKLFKFKAQITRGILPASNSKDFETVVQIKHLSNFWRPP